MSVPGSSSSQTLMDASQSGTNMEPTANEEERQYLKFALMKLLDEANSISENPNVRQNVTRINDVIEKAENLFPKVNHTTDLYLDAKVLDSTTTALQKSLDNLDVGEGNFNLFTFAEEFKIRALNDEGYPSWKVLAALAKPVVFNSIPAWSTLLGSFEISAEVLQSERKKVRQPRQKDQITEKKEPEKVTQIEKSDDGIEMIVKHIYSKLKEQYNKNNHEAINYFRFVVDPTSFSATVENMFHFSFLVKDGLAAIQLDENGEEPMVMPLKKHKNNSTDNANTDRTNPPKDMIHAIFSMDMQTWEDLISVMNIKSAMITPRSQR